MKSAGSRVLTINGGSSSIKFALSRSVRRSDRFWVANLRGSGCRRPR